MRFLDIERQTVWVRQCQYTVLDVGKPGETEFGLCQAISMRDNVRRECIVNYFYGDEIGEVGIDETGEQWWDVRWVADKGYFQGKPAEARKEPQLEKNVWEEKDLRIAKESCIRSAVMLLDRATDFGGKPINVNTAIVVAEEFRKYVYGE